MNLLKKQKYQAIVLALVAAILFGMSAPFSKLLLNQLSPYLLSSLLYLGAGMGMLCIVGVKRINKVKQKEAKLAKQDILYVVLMIVLDIVAPILLLVGLKTTTSATASLLNNFEIVATSLIAMLIFKEAIGFKVWLAIGFITLACILLSIDDLEAFSFSLGAIFILLAGTSWGLENNCTRKLSIKNPMEIVILKGLGSGLGALLIAVFLDAITFNLLYILLALGLGFFSYGLSIYCYVKAQRDLGASRTSAYYAYAPFVGVGLSFLIFKEGLTITFLIALALMIIGTILTINEEHSHEHSHEPIGHEHPHRHDDGHHFHSHEGNVTEEHSHYHVHEGITHTHPHTPDIHHQHQHHKK